MSFWRLFPAGFCQHPGAVGAAGGSGPGSPSLEKNHPPPPPKRGNGSVRPCRVGWQLMSASVMVVCAGLSFLLCIIFSLAVGTLLYMPIICLLLWQCRRNRKGKTEPALSLHLLWELVGISSSPAGLDKPRLGRCPSSIPYCSYSLGVPCTVCPPGEAVLGWGEGSPPPFPLASCW